ncbi:N-acetyltransferase [Chryseotalea sanaruensis]|uniref:N-acetyltransferase n=1 Tax=Chryseotalea sanaruensis TaxID=2482724 RepID=A0A401U9Y4_9BACT|nr:GNAT family N-acetyltransferase [Chryseotalea sanaruensis]GCC51728.1 N-acetyltransferase [Chryseotalea sanaruensis]
MLTGIKIKRVEKQDEIPFNLLLLADPSKENINKYIFSADIYTVKKEGLIIGCYVLQSVNRESIEIKNIAIEPAYQGKGVGTHLLNHAFEIAKTKGFEKILIGTGNSSVAQLCLYQKVGFRINKIIKDFFTDNYDEPIIENGIECRDMIILSKDL